MYDGYVGQKLSEVKDHEGEATWTSMRDNSIERAQLNELRGIATWAGSLGYITYLSFSVELKSKIEWSAI